MLISVHLPKTAGSSFLGALEQHFGARLLQDYADRPITRSALSRIFTVLQSRVRFSLSSRSLSPYQCIHGHFMPLKYDNLSAATPVKFVTWMRDPVERVASHYHHWMRVEPPAHASPMRRRVYRGQWSLRRFCLGSEFRNIYTNFLWGFELERFDFVGISEYYDTELEYFANAFINEELVVRQHNINPVRFGKSHIDDPDLRMEIEAWHSKDVVQYRRALQMREGRLSLNV